MTILDDEPDRGRRGPSTPATGDTRRQLVVIGNGMAGARTVEEILPRGGAEQFSITMFGDEPYGNYNRIMLSHVLSGEETDAEIFLNSLPWYVENDITLHAGVRATRIDRFSKLVYAVNTADGTVSPDPVRRADHRHRQPLVHAVHRGPAYRGRRAAARRFRLPDHRRHPRHDQLRVSTTITAGPS